MKTIIFILIGSTAMASTTTTIHCKTLRAIERRPGVKTELIFQIANLNSNRFELLNLDKEETVKTKPKVSVLGINDNIQLYGNKGDIHIHADGDGCQWTDLVLYKNAGYQRGYVRLKGSPSCGAGSAYSELSCQLTQK